MALDSEDPSWEIDTNTITATVVVTKGAAPDNELSAVVTYSGGSGTDGDTFVNNYIKPVDVGVGAQKAVVEGSNTDPADVPNIIELDGKFSFTLAGISSQIGSEPEVAGAPLPAVLEVVNTGASVEFGAVTYTQEGVYTYEITENALPDSDPRWTIDTQTITAIVTVTKTQDADGNDILSAAVAYDGGVDTFTNTYELLTVDVIGSKIWNDDNNASGDRPNEITIDLYADGVLIDSKAIGESDGWNYQWIGLPKYADQIDGTFTEILYMVKERAVPTNYSVEYSTTSYDITNNHTPGKTGENPPTGSTPSGFAQTGDDTGFTFALIALAALLAGGLGLLAWRRISKQKRGMNTSH